MKPATDRSASSTVLLLFTLAIAATPVAIGANITYDYAERLFFGNGLAELLLEDMNNDGRTDIVYRRGQFNIFDPGGIGVLLSRGDGTFAAQEAELGLIPNHIGIGDMNNDGIADAVAYGRLNPSNVDVELHVVLGAGDGSLDLTTQQIYVPGLTSVLELGDIDNDGNLDILTIESNANVLTVFSGNGDGTVSPAPDIPLVNEPLEFAVDDFNKDGRTDLLVLRGRNGASATADVLLGNAAGGLTAGDSYPIPSIGDAVTLGMIDGDDELDAAVGTAGGEIAILLGNGNGTFNSQDGFFVDRSPRQINIVDVDGDGRRDIVAGHASFDSLHIAILPGNGDGTFGDTGFHPVGRHVGAVVADFDGDGAPDLGAIDSATGELRLVPGNGRGGFGQVFYHAVPDRRSINVKLADLNADNVLDVVVSGSQAALSMLGNNDGTFAEFDPSVGVFQGGEFEIVNVDTNPNPDLVFSRVSSPVLVTRSGLGNGSFAAAQSFVPQAGFPLGRDLAVEDVDNDGHPDAAIAVIATSALVIAFNDGSGGFNTTTEFGSFDIPWTVDIGDINEDGKPDLAVGSRFEFPAGGFEYRQYTAIGNGDGTFAAPVFRGLTGPPYAMTITDVTNDNTADLAWLENRNIVIREGNGDGTLEPEIRIPVDSGPFDLNIADLDRDGIADLVTSNGFDQTVSLRFRNPDGTYRSQDFGLGQRSDALDIDDVDGDGTQDLAVATFFPGGFPRFFEHNSLVVYLGNLAPEITDLTETGAASGSGSITFRAAVDDPDSSSFSTRWDFDGDGFFERTVAGLETTWNYDASGSFDVAVRVLDAEGSAALAAMMVDVVVSDAPPAPDDLSARARPGTVSLVWTPSPGADSYDIYRSTMQGGPYQQIAAGHQTDFATYLDNTVTNGTTYYYVVQALRNGDASADSNEASATPQNRQRR